MLRDFAGSAAMHPLLFEISLGSSGAFRVSAFGALFALAAVAGLGSTLRLAARVGLARRKVEAAALAALLAGILGARLGYVVLHQGEVTSVAQAFSLRSGGLSGPPGMAIGALVFGWVGRRRGLSLPSLFDCAAPGLALGVSFTRVGCWLEGCDYGKPLSASAPAWLARLGTFPRESGAWTEQVMARAIPPSAATSLPVHPSELYESAAGLALLALALFVAGRTRGAGTTALVVLLGYLTLRVLVDASKVTSAEVWCARGLLALSLLLVVAVTQRRRWRPASALRP
jgi:phosphatidylglycerol:prolipoprotein diacylglycerol transferase